MDLQEAETPPGRPFREFYGNARAGYGGKEMRSEALDLNAAM